MHVPGELSDNPHDHDTPELLELNELGDEANRNGCAQPAACDNMCRQPPTHFMHGEMVNVHSDTKAVKTMNATARLLRITRTLGGLAWGAPGVGRTGSE